VWVCIKPVSTSAHGLIHIGLSFDGEDSDRSKLLCVQRDTPGKYGVPVHRTEPLHWVLERRWYFPRLI
jgi:hypothetical protein